MSDNRLIYTETMSFACSVERFQALERLAKAAMVREATTEDYARHRATRKAWEDSMVEFNEALAAFKTAPER